MRALLGSVRVRTTLAATLLTALVLTVASVVIVHMVEHDLLTAAEAALDVALEDTDEGGAGGEAGHGADGETADREGGDAEKRELSGQALGEVQETVDAVTSALVLIVPALVVLLGAGTWFMVGRALRPVRDISAQVATITSTTLDERVPRPKSQDEIAELADLMNQMLDRLEGAAARQQRFIADASHELRSPLATIKAAAEVAEVSRDPEKLHQLAFHLGAETDRMEALIADLLELAELDEDRVPGGHEMVDVGFVVDRAVDRLPATSKNVTVSSAAPVFVIGSTAQLERAVFNVLSNALQHSVQAVHVQVVSSKHHAEVVVDDDGPGINVADRERVFERFVRIGASRDRRTGGSGIGLSLVRVIANRHGGKVSITDAPVLGGTRVILDLGAAQPAGRS